MTEKRTSGETAGIVVGGLTLFVTLLFGIYDRWKDERRQSQPSLVAIPTATVTSNVSAAPAPQVDSPSTHASFPSPPADPNRIQPSISTASSTVEPRRAQPSFSCELPAARYQPFERAICNSPILSGADTALAAAYAGARKRANPLQRASLQTEQRGWMSTRTQCQDDACLLTLYQQRSAELDILYR